MIIDTISIDLQKVAKKSVFYTLFALVFLLLVDSIIHQEFLLSISFVGVILTVFGYLLLILAHELTHLIGFKCFGQVSFRKMKIGVDFKKGVAYATMPEPITNSAMQKSLLFPLWLTGILPGLIGIYLHSGVLLLLSALLIGGAAGDLAMYKELRRFPKEQLILDDPHEPQLHVLK